MQAANTHQHAHAGAPGPRRVCVPSASRVQRQQPAVGRPGARLSDARPGASANPTPCWHLRALAGLYLPTPPVTHESSSPLLTRTDADGHDAAPEANRQRCAVGCTLVCAALQACSRAASATPHATACPCCLAHALPRAHAGPERVGNNVSDGMQLVACSLHLPRAPWAFRARRSRPAVAPPTLPSSTRAALQPKRPVTAALLSISPRSCQAGS